MNDRISIAVVGMAGRFPGARNVEELWGNLVRGTESIVTLSDEDILDAGGDAASLDSPRLVKAGGVLADAEAFDAAFFGITPREAEVLDPQHRLLLETAHEALDDAGYDPFRYQGAIGVYAGGSTNGYLAFHVLPRLGREMTLHNLEPVIQNGASTLVSRLSYKLNLRGPSAFVQTGCSTSLFAIHLACQELLTYRCDMALAGGVGFNISQRLGYYFYEGGPFSPDGKCRPFDDHGRGTVPGNGVGLVALKRLEDALDDRDTIHAIVLGSASNNDGSAKVGFTAPSVQGQTEAISAALTVADVAAESVGFVEAHGTATALGDPIEFAGLASAYGTEGRPGHCALGSIKSNIGHLDAAAGVAGFIKAALAVERGLIPPTLHFKTPNRQIDLERSAFYVNSAPVSWNDARRRAAVSSFGVGGTNVHIILESPPRAPARAEAGAALQVLALSAKTPSALDEMTRRLARQLSSGPELDLADVAYTLQVGRRELEHRRCVVARGGADAAAALEAALAARDGDGRAPSDGAPPVAFVFPGHGAQYPRMGAGLYRQYAGFRRAVDRCAEILCGELDCDVRNVLYAAHGAQPAPELSASWLIQPAVFVVEYALACLWRGWGIEPRAMVGHSLGEYTAACVSGVFELEDALRLVAARGRLVEKMAPGLMLAVSVSEDQLASLLGPGLSLAAVNGPGQCVVSGTPERVESFAATCTARGLDVRRIAAERAGHGHLVDSIRQELVDVVSTFRLAAPKIPYISNVTGTWITDAQATSPDYYGEHLRRTVRFADGVRTLARDPRLLFLEVGPGRSLSSAVKRIVADGPARTIIHSMRHADEVVEDERVLLGTLGRLWANGCRSNWAAVHEGEQRRRVPLPTYPFERQRYWLPLMRARQQGDVAETGLRAPRMAATSLVAVAREQRRAPEEQGERWVVIDPSPDLGDCIVAAARDAGIDVVLAASDQASQRDARIGLSFATERALEDALRERLLASGRDHRLIYFGAFGRAPRSLDEAMDMLRPVSLLQRAVEHVRSDENIRIDVLVTQAIDVSGAEPVTPAMTACLALAGVPAHVRPRFLDVEPLLREQRLAERARQIVHALADAPEQPVVAVRGRTYWTPGEVAIGPGSAEAREAQPVLAGSIVLIGALDEALLSLAESAATPERRILWLEPSFAGEGTAARIADDVARNQVIERVPVEWERETDRLCSQYVLEYLDQHLGLAPGHAMAVDAIASRLGVIPQRRPLFDTLLGYLVEDGLATRAGDTIELRVDPKTTERAGARTDRLARAYPSFANSCDLLASCVASYHALFTGRTDGVSVLYPQGKTEVLDAILERNAELDVPLHLQMARALVGRLLHRARGRRLRVMEIGGGNRFLTRALMPELKQHDVEYLFTDVSRLFISKAKAWAQQEGLDWMQFGLFDITRDPGEQGYAPGSIDALVAFNVVHAAPRLGAALRNIGSVLRPDGELVLVETVRPLRWSTMTIGMLDVWWNYVDEGLRAGSPFPTAEGWMDVLARTGFRAVGAYPEGEAGRSGRYAVIWGRRGAAPPCAPTPRRDARAPVERLEERLAALHAASAGVVRVRADLTERDAVRAILARASTTRPAVLALRLDDSGDGLRSPEELGRDAVARMSTLVDAAAACNPGLVLAVQDGGAGPAMAVAQAMVEARAQELRGSGVPWTVVTLAPTTRIEPEQWQSILRAGLRESRIAVVAAAEGSVSLDGMGDAAADARPSTAARAAEASAANPAPPRTETEKHVAELWRKTLGIPDIAVTANFFDLGGESLLATRLLSDLCDTYRIEMTVREFFEVPTIAALAATIDTRRARGEPTRERIRSVSRDRYRVSIGALDTTLDSENGDTHEG
jgi:acyl transferase domain-containing protein/SAM-dependent methyltransferase/acyl carrier protein